MVIDSHDFPSFFRFETLLFRHDHKQFLQWSAVTVFQALQGKFCNRKTGTKPKNHREEGNIWWHQGNKGKLFKGTWYPGGPSVLSITNLAESATC
jgi:hypothetical protein